ncbi:alpha-amylase family glycosyl hydrolase [Caulobacter segnis]
MTRRLDSHPGAGRDGGMVRPIFKNRAVQGPPGARSAAHHGYWITDFTDVDPHFGTKADFKALVEAAHARGLKVYMDIVVNHTADIIQYRECPESRCAYRGVADYPYTRRGGVAGAVINDGFDGKDFSKLKRSDWAYTPYVPAGQEHAKTPDWLNDPIYYHNRGESTFTGESSLTGDFATLDDVSTENPRVVQGFIEIYGKWIDDFGVDGFRIDTARHVNPEFWQAFVPAMLARAKARGIPELPHLRRGVRPRRRDPGQPYTRRQAAGGAGLRVPVGGDRRRHRPDGHRPPGPCLRRRSGLRGRRGGALAAADLPGQSTTWAASVGSC